MARSSLYQGPIAEDRLEKRRKEEEARSRAEPAYLNAAAYRIRMFELKQRSEGGHPCVVIPEISIPCTNTGTAARLQAEIDQALEPILKRQQVRLEKKAAKLTRAR